MIRILCNRQTSVFNVYNIIACCDKSAANLIKTSSTNPFHPSNTAVRCYGGNVGSDYGKYAEPSKVESIYHELVDTSWIKTVEEYLTTVHDVTGSPWWLSILICTFAMRSLVMTPLMIVQLQSMGKFQRIMPLLEKVDKELKAEVKVAKDEYEWSDEMANLQYRSNIKRHQKNIFEKHKVPGVFRRFLLPWVQIPLWVSLSVALRDLTMSLPTLTQPSIEKLAIADQLLHEGCLWFTNLLAPDPYFILPVIFCLANLSVIEVYRGDGKTPLQGFYKYLVYSVRGLSIVLLPVACQLPSGVVLYWVYSSLYGVVQALFLRSPKVKQFFKIPILKNESKSPYRDILSRFNFTKK